MNNKINLDEYFAKARNQESFFSEENARNLLENTAAGYAKPHHLFKQIKGIKTMSFITSSLAAAAAVAVISFNLLDGIVNDSNKEKPLKEKTETFVTAPTEIQNNVKEITQELTLASNENNKIEHKQTNTITTIKEQEEKTDNFAANGTYNNRVQINVTTNNIKGVKIIELTPDELADLGITRKEGVFKLYGMVKTNEPTPIVLTPTKVKLGGFPDKDTRYFANIEPSIITDDKGNQILTSFSENGSTSGLSAFYQRKIPGTNQGMSAFTLNALSPVSSGNSFSNDAAVSSQVTYRSNYQIIYDREKDTFEHLVFLNVEDTIGISMNVISEAKPKSESSSSKVQNLDDSSNDYDSSMILMRSTSQVAPDGTGTIHTIESTGWGRHHNHVVMMDIPEEEAATYGADTTQDINIIIPNMAEASLGGIKIDSSKMAEIELQAKEFYKQHSNAGLSALRDHIDTIVTNTFINFGLNVDSVMNFVDSISNNVSKHFFRGRIEVYDFSDTAKIYNFQNDSNEEPDTYFDWKKENQDIETEDTSKINDSHSDNFGKTKISTDISVRNTPDVNRHANDITVVQININTLKRVNKLVPVAVKFEDNTEYILWFDATPEFITKLPERYRNDLMKEYAIAEKTNDFCVDKPIAGKEAFFDVWRSCSGAIKNLKVYPNPAQDVVNVMYELSDDRAVRVSLHDLTGKQCRVLSDMQDQKKCKCENNFSIKDLPAGMYLLVLETDKGEQTVQRFIKE